MDSTHGRKRKITFVISSLRAGGAERVMTTLANYWAQCGWEISIVTLNHGSAPVSYSLHPQVKHIHLQRSPVQPSRLIKFWRWMKNFSIVRLGKQFRSRIRRLSDKVPGKLARIGIRPHALRMLYDTASAFLHYFTKNSGMQPLAKETDRVIRRAFRIVKLTIRMPASALAAKSRWCARLLWNEARRVKHLGVYCWERQATGGWLNRCVVLVFDLLPTRLGWEVQLARDLKDQVMETEPEAVISFMTGNNVRTIRALQGTNVPIIVSERTAPQRRFLHNGQLVEMRKKLYPKADCLVVQTDEAKKYYENMIRKPVQVIPNPVPKIHVRTSVQGGRCIVAVGRLVYEKGYDMLIQAFARIHNANPDWRLEIWGDGPLRKFLAREIDKTGLSNGVLLCGNTSRVEDIFTQAEMYVLSSRYEGFPNALCEAMSCGIAPIAFDCPVGPRAIITHNVDGLLVPANNVDAMCKAMERLIADQAMRRKIAHNAKKVTDRYSVDRVTRMWEETISEYGYAKASSS